MGPTVSAANYQHPLSKTRSVLLPLPSPSGARAVGVSVIVSAARPHGPRPPPLRETPVPHPIHDASAAPPPPPRPAPQGEWMVPMERNAHVIDSLEAARRLIGLPSPVHVEVTGCDPVKDAAELLELITEKVFEGEWVVEDAAIRRAQQAQGGLRGAAAHQAGAGPSGGARERCSWWRSQARRRRRRHPGAPGHRRAVVLRVLGLGPGARAPRRFSEELFQSLQAARGRLWEQMLACCSAGRSWCR
ncbi:hypothetical protein ACP4OV_009008 [Aristida adscensionis]